MDQTALVALVAGVLGFIAKEMFGAIKGGHQKRQDALDKALEKNTEEIQKLTIAIVELKSQLTAVSEKLLSLPKLERDVNEAHIKIRELRAETKRDA